MKIIDLLTREKLSLSFEVFPPKTETSFESVKNATEEIAKLHPAFMSVTYGAGGGTSKYTLDIAKNIKVYLRELRKILNFYKLILFCVALCAGSGYNDEDKE